MTAITVPSNIYNAVAPVAKQYGVPDSVWETVAYDESGFNPQAIGDNNTSFGLFQLHEGGQLPQSYYADPQAVFDPALNAQLAMPAIARGYQQSGAVNPTSLGWWETFGSISGHPGGTPGVDPANIAEAQNLLKAYPSFGSGGNSTNPLTDSTSTGDCCNGDLGCQICKTMVGATGNPGTICCPGVASQGVSGVQNDINTAILQAIQSAFQNLFTSLQPAFLKVGIFLIGLVLLILAFWILLQKRGVSNA